jgi:aldehyde:ferredoxin oxidoreductase
VFTVSVVTSVEFYHPSIGPAANNPVKKLLIEKELAKKLRAGQGAVSGLKGITGIFISGITSVVPFSKKTPLVAIPIVELEMTTALIGDSQSNVTPLSPHGKVRKALF